MRLRRKTELPGATIELGRRKQGLQMLALIFAHTGVVETTNERVSAKGVGQKRNLRLPTACGESIRPLANTPCPGKRQHSPFLGLRLLRIPSIKRLGNTFFAKALTFLFIQVKGSRALADEECRIFCHPCRTSTRTPPRVS